MGKVDGRLESHSLVTTGNRVHVRQRHSEIFPGNDNSEIKGFKRILIRIKYLGSSKVVTKSLTLVKVT